MAKPLIMIGVRDADEQVLKELLAGIEEEQVLFEVFTEITLCNEYTLAEDAAMRSGLELGVSVYRNKILLQPKKMVQIGPLPLKNLTPRQMGQNAARFVKNKPLIL